MLPLHHTHHQSAEGAGVEPARLESSTGFQPGPVASRVVPPLADRAKPQAAWEAPRPGVEPGIPRSKRGVMSVSPSGHKKLFDCSRPLRGRPRRGRLQPASQRPATVGVSGRQGSRTLLSSRRTHLSGVVRPTGIRLPSSNQGSGIRNQESARGFHRFLIPDSRQVDRRGVEPRFPTCEAGVVPLDQQPVFRPTPQKPARIVVLKPQATSPE